MSDQSEKWKSSGRLVNTNQTSEIINQTSGIMLAEAQMNLIHELVQKHTKEELIWISGYLAGLANSNAALPTVNGNGYSVTNAVAAPASIKTITLLYGTETGNAKRAASTAAHQIKQHGQRVKLVSVDQYKFHDLAKENNLLIIISTQGDGDPPVAAQKFYDYLHTTAEKLPDTNFSVLALGSTSYPQFCKIGIDVDQQLERLGGKRLLPVVKCDDDFEEDADEWLNTVLQKLSQVETPSVTAAPAPIVAKPVEKGKKYFTGKVTTNINLNDEGSHKETHHIEFALNEELDYKPGDAAGVIPENREELVHKIIDLAGVTGQESFEYKTEHFIIYNLLKKKVNLQNLSERLVKKYAALVGQEIPDTRMDFYDLLRIYPVKDIDQFIGALQLLEPIAPRLYSISSSPAAHNGELHLTIATDAFIKNNEKAYGLGSYFLNCLPLDTELQMFLHRQKHFHLPPDDKDLIMIGPGTGIAPLRSFIAERDAIGATGRNWLFFGEQHFTTDFLYQTEIQGWKDTGALQKVSLAFSRDQQEKIYVQHRMNEESAEVWDWINGGAYIAICGAKNPMSKDVEQELMNIIATYGKLTPEGATAYLAQLSKDGRYAKDVW
jgi:sulfite reductase (NADPH) flavoprotein alpha-component